MTDAASGPDLAAELERARSDERWARDAALAASARLLRLRDLATELAATQTSQEVVDVVLDRGLPVLDAVACAAWLRDPDGRLRLAAARGYDAAALAGYEVLDPDSATPAGQALRTGSSVWLGSLADRDERFPELRDQPTIGRSFAALPLPGDAVPGDPSPPPVGVLAVSFPRGRSLSEADDLSFCEAVAVQCAATLRRNRALEAERRARANAELVAARLARLVAVASRLTQATTVEEVVEAVVDGGTRELSARAGLLYVVDRDRLHLLRSTGLSAADSLAEHHDGGGTSAWSAPVREAVASGQPVRRTVDGRHLAVWPLSAGSRRLGALAFHLPGPTLPDVDLDFLATLSGQCAQAFERVRLREVERRSLERLRVLADASGLLTGSGRPERVLPVLCRSLVPGLAEAAALHLVTEAGELELVAVAHADPAREPEVRRLVEQGPDVVVRELARVQAGGRPRAWSGAEIAGVVGDLGLGSLVAVPLVARGRPLGVLTLASLAQRPAAVGDDLAPLEEFAERIALALDNARLFAQRSEIAGTLQRSLLPAGLPELPGAAVAVRYLPGTEGTTVGGDFFDVFPLPNGRYGLVVGDVMGRGVRAAAVMGQLRAAIRSYALEGHAPASLLTRLDRLVESLEQELIVTCVYGEWDAPRRTVTLSCAGHLPPLLAVSGEPARFCDLDPGVPLGVGGGVYRESELTLPPNALLLAYTDGLVEAPDLPVEEGMRRLAAAIDAHPAADAATACEVALAAARPAAEGDVPAYHRDDDTALLALVCSPAPAGGLPEQAVADDRALTLELPAAATSPATARSAVAAMLARWGLDTLTDTALLLVSELVTNGVRHAGTGLRLHLERRGPAGVRVCVVDHAPATGLRGRNPGMTSEGGRGLFLVESLSAAWGVERQESGKQVWFDLDPEQA